MRFSHPKPAEGCHEALPPWTLGSAVFGRRHWTGTVMYLASEGSSHVLECVWAHTCMDQGDAGARPHQSGCMYVRRMYPRALSVYLRVHSCGCLHVSASKYCHYSRFLFWYKLLSWILEVYWLCNMHPKGITCWNNTLGHFGIFWKVL